MEKKEKGGKAKNIFLMFIFFKKLENLNSRLKLKI